MTTTTTSLSQRRAPTAEELIKLYEMQPHPEGGFFKETYRSAGSVPEDVLNNNLEQSSKKQSSSSSPASVFSGARSYSTGIYFMIPSGAKSTLHRLKSDEMWHFYLGEPLVVIEIHPDGKVVRTVLGPDVLNGQCLQHVVPANVWFGSYLLADESTLSKGNDSIEGSHCSHTNGSSSTSTSTAYAFVGCTVSPGFDFSDFEIAERSALLAQYPHASAEIERLT